MQWIEYAENEGRIIYGKVSEDGKVRETAIRGHAELDAYLEWVEAGNSPEYFWAAEGNTAETLDG